MFRAIVRPVIAAAVVCTAIFLAGGGVTNLTEAAGPGIEPVAPGVEVDLDNEGEDVLGCLMDLGYKPLPFGRLHTGPGHLEVTQADRLWCGAQV